MLQRQGGHDRYWVYFIIQRGNCFSTVKSLLLKVTLNGSSIFCSSFQSLVLQILTTIFIGVKFGTVKNLNTSTYQMLKIGVGKEIST